jgi:hypothetical protein
MRVPGIRLNDSCRLIPNVATPGFASSFTRTSSAARIPRRDVLLTGQSSFLRSPVDGGEFVARRAVANTLEARDLLLREWLRCDCHPGLFSTERLIAMASIKCNNISQLGRIRSPALARNRMVSWKRGAPSEWSVF